MKSSDQFYIYLAVGVAVVVGIIAAVWVAWKHRTGRQAAAGAQVIQAKMDAAAVAPPTLPQARESVVQPNQAFF